ncbi:hypothetical protein I7I50_08841 [Histoplasma capsulatum G186AR]|uniref:Uncharacterized protein n=1 Tax=Ajellomyces capsulatus TaxID=5037 RepID=A0A8H8D002_AJECA|nr:hypothetical protein I7I52_06355 [Histoplasma capsulatum]QSS73905.1 hypothetical protein I7I50_08841 [Histoplasma capsulatum G186AR]
MRLNNIEIVMLQSPKREGIESSVSVAISTQFISISVSRGAACRESISSEWHHGSPDLGPIFQCKE